MDIRLTLGDALGRLKFWEYSGEGLCVAFTVAFVELRVAHDNFGNNVLTRAARLDKFDNAVGIMQFHNIYGWHLGFSFGEIVQMLGQPAAMGSG